VNNLITKRAIAYSILAHIKNSGLLASGPLDVFIPLVKKCLHVMNTKKSQYKGENISEIKTIIEEEYGIDIPMPVLKTILQKLSLQINSKEEKVFELYNDGAFWIRDYVFEDYDIYLEESKRKIRDLQNTFKEFCKIYNVDNMSENSIIKFIEKNRHSISRYLANSQLHHGEDLTISALFVNYFKNIPQLYTQIKDLYLGSTLTCALEYEFSETKLEITLLLDTNFIVSLIDLNTSESTHTCKKLLEVCQKIGYKFQILSETLEEIRNLINFKSTNYDKVAISKYVNKEDIYNACERRKLSKVDLDRIADNLENTLVEYKINIVANTDKLRNKAKFSKEYTMLKKFRNTDKAALHDAMALIFVKEKRGKNTREFEKVNCWFVNNSISHDIDSDGIDALINSNHNQYQPEIIKADDLLNILWLSNPNINISLADSELVDMGLTSLVAFTLNESLPKARIIKELDDNIQKYKTPEITDRDVYLLSNRIASNQIKDIEKLNELANRSAKEFNQRVKEEAQKQEIIEKERAVKLDELFRKMETTINAFSEQKIKLEQRLETKKQKEIAQITTINEAKLKEKDLKSKQEKLEETKRRIESINRRKKNADSEVEKKYTNKRVLIIILIILYYIALLIITYKIGWEIMEPITYFLGLGATVGLYVFFAIKGHNFDFRKYFNNSKIEIKKNVYEKYDISIDNLKELEELKLSLEKELENG
jgi:hypothetical protein